MSTPSLDETKNLLDKITQKTNQDATNNIEESPSSFDTLNGDDETGHNTKHNTTTPTSRTTTGTNQNLNVEMNMTSSPKKRHDRMMIIPFVFSVSMWVMALYSKPIIPQYVYQSFLPKGILHSIVTISDSNANTNNTTTSSNRTTSTIDHTLLLDNLYDAYLLGKISQQIIQINNSTTAYKLKQQNDHGNIATLLHQASTILHLDYNLTENDIIEIIPEVMLKMQQQRTYKSSRFQRVKRLFTFVNIVSIISVIGIIATLIPTLRVIVDKLRLVTLWELLWNVLKTKIIWIYKNIIKHILEPATYLILFLMMDITVNNYPKTTTTMAMTSSLMTGGSRAQIGNLTAGLTTLTFFWHRRKYHDYRTILNKDEKLLISIWFWSFLTPMAYITESQVIGFFSVGSIFCASGFFILSLPGVVIFGFDEGEKVIERCMIVSLVIIITSLVVKQFSFPPRDVMEIYEPGAAIFGMMVFGCAGLIKSVKWRGSAKSFVYPVSWLVLACIGSLLSYSSLTNTSITFVFLWMSWYYYYLVGVTSVAVFFSCIALFYVSLWLKSHPEFVASLFKV